MDLSALKRIGADLKSGKLATQLRADPKLRVVGIRPLLFATFLRRPVL